MKKILFFILTFIGINSFAQNAFSSVELSVKNGHGQALKQLVDNFYQDVKFKEGSGFALQRLWQGSDHGSHRLLWWGPLGNRGRVDGDVKDYVNAAFWASLRPHLDGPCKA